MRQRLYDRGCAECRTRLLSPEQRRVVLCDGCLEAGFTVEAAERRLTAEKRAMSAEIALRARVAANATCRDENCACRRAVGAH